MNTMIKKLIEERLKHALGIFLMETVTNVSYIGFATQNAETLFTEPTVIR